MTSTEQYAVVAQQFKSATEQSTTMWKQSAQLAGEQVERLTQLPTLNPVTGVQRYFEFVQRAVEVNRDLAVSWAEAMRAMSGGVGAATTLARRQLDTVADTVVEQAESVEAAAEHQVLLAEEAAKAEARRVRAAERAAEKEAHEKAREPYVTMSKTELSDALAERELPKSGTVDELIERLVASDSVRAPYVGLTKAELADQLTERELPKSGTVEELIGRLVDADQAQEESR